MAQPLYDSTRPLTISASFGVGEHSTKDEAASPLIYHGYPVQLEAKLRYESHSFVHTGYISSARSGTLLPGLTVSNIAFPSERKVLSFFVSSGYSLMVKSGRLFIDSSYWLGGAFTFFSISRHYYPSGNEFSSLRNYSWDAAFLLGPTISTVQEVPFIGKVRAELELPLVGYIMRPPYIGYFIDYNTPFISQNLKGGTVKVIGSFFYPSVALTYNYPVSNYFTADAQWRLRYYYVGSTDHSNWSEQSLQLGVAWRPSL